MDIDMETAIKNLEAKLIADGFYPEFAKERARVIYVNTRDFLYGTELVKYPLEDTRYYVPDDFSGFPTLEQIVFDYYRGNIDRDMTAQRIVELLFS